jgi:MFS family permease
LFFPFLSARPATEKLTDFSLRNMRWLFYDGVTAAFQNAIVMTYYVFYLEALGATGQQIGLLSSLTSLLMLITMMPGAWLTEKVGSRKLAVLAGAGGLSRVLLLTSVFIPFLFEPATAVVLAIAAKILIDNFTNLSLPAWTSLSADIVPIDFRGRYFASRNLAMNISTMLATFGIGLLISAVGKPGGYQAALAVAFGFGALATFCYSRIQEPKSSPGAAVPSYSPLSLLKTLKEDRVLRNYCLFILMWGGSINIAGPFFPLYFVRELGATPDIVGVVHTVMTLASLPATFFFGKLVDRWGGRKTQLLAGFLIPLLPLMWLLPRSPWETLPVYIYDGIVWSGYQLAAFTFMLSLATPRLLTRYNALTQMSVATAAMVGSAIGGMLIDVIGFRGMFALSGAGRIVAMLFLLFFVTPQKTANSLADAKPHALDQA